MKMPNRKPNRLSAAWLLALLGATCAQAADTYTIAGTVVNRVTGQPLNKARVYRQGLTSTRLSPAKTGNSGSMA